MGDYVVIYEPENGEMEIFGTFEGEDNAREWMQQDAELAVPEAEDEGTELELCEGEDTVVIEGYAKWTLKEMTPA